ncbi:MAG TPA: hypothetical protein VF543_22270 [Pyrinomonadaceae bacterium]|jgi:hypothetical protein
MHNETIYDNEIAPQLLAIAKRCEELGMPFVASVEYETGETGRTEAQAQNASPKQLVIHWAARCNGNVDALFMAIDKYAKEHGHSSIVLQLRGNDNLASEQG